MPGIRAAIDTCVVWSGLAHPEHPFGEVIDLWYEGKYDLVWNKDTLDEYKAVLLDEDYLRRFRYRAEVEEFLQLVEVCGEFAPKAKVPLPPIRDVDDVKWQDAAVGGLAKYLVTVDARAFLDDPVLIRSMRELGVDVVRPGIFLRDLVRL